MKKYEKVFVSDCRYGIVSGMSAGWRDTPWVEGGRTIASNCQMLCQTHNRAKGNK